MTNDVVRKRAIFRFVARVIAFAATGWGVVAVFLAAFAVWWIQAIAIPLAGGRDFGTYLGAYDQLFKRDPIDLGYVLGRTPIAPLVSGMLLDPFGGRFAEPGIALLYAASITAWFLATRRFSGAAALVVVLVLLAYPSYGILFHELASDTVFAAAFAGWSLLAVHVLEAPSSKGFALLGSGVAVLVLVRPSNQALVALALLALAVSAPWGRRVTWVAAFVAPVLIVLGAWTVHNGVRFGDYTISRAAFPTYRVYLSDRIVRPENGPASRDLARAVERDLLPFEPYRSYGITLERFFADPTPRMFEDLVALSNRRWGWDSDQKILRDVAIEAIRTHPATYARGVGSTVWGLLRRPVFRPLGSEQGDDAQLDDGGGGKAATVVIDGEVLPKPSEEEAIPAAREGGVTTSDYSIRTVWTSPYEHHLVFDHPGDEARYDALHRRIVQLASGLPDRAGVAILALRLNQASRWYPPPVLWLVVGLIALVMRRPGRTLALITPTLAALIVIVVSALGVPTVPHLSVPVTPAFAVLAAAALVTPRRTVKRLSGSRSARVAG